MRGTDKLWALKSSLEIPLVHIAGIRADPEVARGWYYGIRMPGTNARDQMNSDLPTTRNLLLIRRQIFVPTCKPHADHPEDEQHQRRQLRKKQED